jgi:hypothetical protein
MHTADLDSADLPQDAEIVFTLYWEDEQRWDDQDYRMRVA